MYMQSHTFQHTGPILLRACTERAYEEYNPSEVRYIRGKGKRGIHTKAEEGHRPSSPHKQQSRFLKHWRERTCT